MYIKSLPSSIFYYKIIGLSISVKKPINSDKEGLFLIITSLT